MLRRYRDPLEADLQRVYGVDLADLWRGELSLRRLSVLIAYLPPGNALDAAMAAIPYGWTHTDSLLADLYHALSGEPHPAKPTPGRKSGAGRTADLVAKLKAQRERLKGKD